MIDVSNLEVGNIDFENSGFLTFFGNSDANLTINGLVGKLLITLFFNLNESFA